jgi:hypothetical protein
VRKPQHGRLADSSARMATRISNSARHGRSA